MKKFWSSLLMMMAAVFWAGAACAGSGAFRLEVPDAGALGKGDAFVGEANTPAAVYYNPAGMTQIVGNSVSVGLALVQPKAKYTSLSGDETKMQQQSFPIPHFYYVTRLGSEKIAVGIGATSAWGLGTEWAQDSFARYSATRSLIENKDYMITLAYQVTDQLSLGMGVDIDDSHVDKQKKIIQVGANDANFRLKGDNMAAGMRVAAMYKMNDRHQFGLMYRSPIHRKYHGKVALQDLSSVGQASLGGFSYQQVFGGSTYETDVTVDNTLPQSLVFGYNYKPNERLTLNADLEWMDWSSTKNEELYYPEETDPTRLGVLNNGNPVNRDWHSALSCAVGAEYKLLDQLRLRSGYFFHQSPVPQDTWEPNLPDANSHSVTAGLGYDVNKSLTLDLGYSAMFYQARSISNNVADAYGGIDGKYEQWVNLVLATATYNF
jgi:long-chain fatty acid transport protein